MDPRLSILTFPQRFDGASLHLRVLVVPRLERRVERRSAAAADRERPDAGDTRRPSPTPTFSSRSRVMDGLDRFPVRRARRLHGTAAGRRAACSPTPAPLFEALVAPGPGRFKLSADPPRLAEAVEDRDLHQEVPAAQLPRRRSCSPVHARRTPSPTTAITARSRTAGTRIPAFVDSPDTVSWGQIYAYCLRHPQLAVRLGLIREASFAVDGRAVRRTAGSSTWTWPRAAPTRPQAAADFAFLTRYAARIPPLDGRRAARSSSRRSCSPCCFDDPIVPGPPAALGNYDAGVHRGGRLRRRLRQDRARHAAGQPEPAGRGPGRLRAAHRHRHPSRLGRRADPDLAEPAAEGRPDGAEGARGKPQRLDAPMGVFGYRIDAREHGDRRLALAGASAEQGAAHARRHCRSARQAQLFEGELGVEVHPMQLDGNQATGQFWLPVVPGAVERRVARPAGRGCRRALQDRGGGGTSREPRAAVRRRRASTTFRCATATPTSSACA